MLQKLTNKQRNFMQDYKHRFICLLGGFQAGKTISGALKMINMCKINSGCGHIVVAPTYKMLRDASRKKFLDLLDFFKLKYSFPSKQENIVYFPNRSYVIFRSGDNPDHLKGPTLAGFWLDEGGQCKKEVWDMLISRISDPLARVNLGWVTTTPEGFNWLYDTFGTIKDPKVYAMLKMKTSENIYLQKEYYESLQDSYDTQLQKQYLEAEFVNIYTGNVYYMFSRDFNTIKQYQPDTRTSIIITCDFNYGICVWLIAQKKNDIVYFFDEIVMEKANTDYMCDEVAKRVFENDRPKYQGIIWIGDYTSLTKHNTTSSISDWQIIENRFKNYLGFEMKIMPNPKIKDRIVKVNKMLETRKVLFSENMKYTIEDMERVAWSPNEHEKDKRDPKRTHATDCVDYLVNQECEIYRKESYIL